MRTDDFILLQKGFFNRQVNELRILRRAVALVISPHVKDMPPFSRLWYVPGDEELERKQKEHRDKASLDTLKMLKEGGFEYVLENGKMVQRKINLN